MSIDTSLGSLELIKNGVSWARSGDIPPAEPVIGTIYYNTTDNTTYIFNGPNSDHGAWMIMGVDAGMILSPMQPTVEPQTPLEVADPLLYDVSPQ
jgi:hypothetical protein